MKAALHPCQVAHGQAVDLSKIDPEDKSLFPHVSKKDSALHLRQKTAKLMILHRVLYAQAKHRVLVVFQSIDTGGKDGAVRGVFGALDPGYFRVVSFKRPSELELSHDYLWRVHHEMPAKGEIVAFNRSHYEDILAVGVKGLAPEAVWKKRFDHINHFEQMLADEGTTILKFFLYISKDEQRQRLQDRVNEPEKHWKFNPADLEDRARWDDFMKAYEEMLPRTSTAAAPWFIVPSNRKWYRNLVVADVVLKAMEKLPLEYPAPEFDPAQFKKIV